jgi:hypothetical protein
MTGGGAIASEVDISMGPSHNMDQGFVYGYARFFAVAQGGNGGGAQGEDALRSSAGRLENSLDDHEKRYTSFVEF